MAIKVTRPSESERPKGTLVSDWQYGQCGVGDTGAIWCRVEWGAIRVNPDGQIMVITTQALIDTKKTVPIDPNLNLELIFTKGN